MEFRLLGALEIRRDGERVELGGPRERALLAGLLLRRNETVGADYLVDVVWDRPVVSTASNLRTHVSALRRRLTPRPGGGERLVTHKGGYLLLVDDDELDLAVFDRFVSEGERAWSAGRAERALVWFGDALALWRGEPLEGQRVSEPLGMLVTAVVERRLSAVERYTRVALELGRHDSVVELLGPVLRQHPLREELWCQLMLALSRSGRVAEALDAYGRVRRRLVEELGIEPGQRLRELHARVLRDEPGCQPGPASARPPISQLPVDVPDFVGRGTELGCLTEALAGCGGDAPPPVTVVAGGPGVGKSTLVLHAAHRAASRFADGHLYLDLAGTSDAPRSPAALLAELLAALGVTGGQVPDGVPARAALFRSLLSDRRMLLVLDDAADTAQVRPLLPASRGCAVLVTSRQLLTDLPAARHVGLDVLGEDEATDLFTRIVGRERAVTEPEQVVGIVRACGHLPLAIRIAAGKLVGRPSWPLRLLRERLRDESRRLTELRLGELGVRASFDASVATLPADAVLGFRLLGLLGPTTLPCWVLGPLLDRPDATEVLDTLADVNLVTQKEVDANGTPRYRLHDLLRAFAVDGMEGVEGVPRPARKAAVARLLAVWLDLAKRALARMPPSLLQPPRGAAPRRRLPHADRLIADPVAWFDAERDALLGAIDLAARWELDEAAWELAATLAPYFDHRSRYDNWRRGHDRALDAVRAAGNARGEAVLLRGLAQVDIYPDRYDAATRKLLRSRDLCQRVGDKRGAGLAIAGLGTIARAQERYDEALGCYEEALDAVTAAGEHHLEALLRNSRAAVLAASGRRDEAHVAFEDALALCLRLGDTHREAVVLREFSVLLDSSGAAARAMTCLDRALAVFTALDDERCLASTLLRTGRIHAGRGRYEAATTTLGRAVEIYTRNGNTMEEAQCCELLGDLAVARDDVTAATRLLSRAVRRWHAIGGVVQAARVEERLYALERPGTSRGH